jgi:5-methylcytosine-specific restriction endonuclease McrA
MSRSAEAKERRKNRVGRPSCSRRRGQRKTLARHQKHCHICGKWLDFDAPFHSPDFVTLDHIVPISRGGSNALKNLHLAHRQCNERKADVDPFQQPEKYAELYEK